MHVAPFIKDRGRDAAQSDRELRIIDRNAALPDLGKFCLQGAQAGDGMDGLARQTIAADDARDLA